MAWKTFYCLSWRGWKVVLCSYRGFDLFHNTWAWPLFEQNVTRIGACPKICGNIYNPRGPSILLSHFSWTVPSVPNFKESTGSQRHKCTWRLTECRMMVQWRGEREWGGGLTGEGQASSSHVWTTIFFFILKCFLRVLIKSESNLIYSYNLSFTQHHFFKKSFAHVHKKPTGATLSGFTVRTIVQNLCE